MPKDEKPGSVASVILDSYIDKSLDYAIPTTLQGKVVSGLRVKVPVRNTLQNATVLEVKSHSSFPKLRKISSIDQQEVLPKDLLSLSLWMSKYYCAPLQKVFKCIVPSSLRNETAPEEKYWLSLAQSHKKTLKAAAEKQVKAPAQAKVLTFLANQKKGSFLQDLIEELSVSRSVVESLVEQKWIRKKKQKVNLDDLLEKEQYFLSPEKKLTDEQQKCLEGIAKSLESKQFASHLIFGVTGSGKTEIYMQAMRKALDQNQSVILLMPEIALTSQMIERFRSRFEEKIAIIHHQRSPKERLADYENLRNSKTRIVIGARSAVFSPVNDLGLIIVDEEHETSYKQAEEAPFYHARDVAVMRAKMNNCPVVLGTATPSIESFYNAQSGKYVLHELKNRPTQHSLPKVQIVNMADEMKRSGGFTHFSEKLIDGMKERFKKGEQTLIFLNRRGFHTSVICLSCENSWKCPHCDLTLTFHKKRNFLKCHLCDYQVKNISTCPSCQSNKTFKFQGFGTEHVERSLRALFPEIRTLRLDRDTTTKKGSIDHVFKEFRSGKADVLIGTQMIAKGLHFPSVTLVGILNADASLNIPDFRSSEHVFQKIVQVSGRSGRSDLPGEVVIQTFMPTHPTIEKAAAQDYLSFYNSEVEERRLFDYPPFCQLVRVSFASKEENLVENYALCFRNQIAKYIPQDAQALSVSACGYAKIKDRFRFQFLLKGKTIQSLLPSIERVQKELLAPHSIRVYLDVNPTSTYF